MIRLPARAKLQAAERRELVAFEVDVIDVDTRCGRSVVVHGRASVCSPAEQRTFADRSETTAWADGPRHHLIRIRPSRVTGRVLVPA